MPRSTTPRLNTRRLELVACDAPLALAAAEDRTALARLLEAVVPDEWPPSSLADLTRDSAKRLAAAPEQAGWWLWCLVGRAVDGKRVLVGACSPMPPDERGVVALALEVLPAYRRRGYGSEALGELLEWALGQSMVQRVRVATRADNKAAIRAMEKNFMRRIGPGPDEGSVLHEAARLDFGKTL